MITCPYCAKEIREEAIDCKHCGSTLEPERFAVGLPKPSVMINGLYLVILGGLIVAGGVVVLAPVPVAGIGAIMLGIIIMAAGFNPTGRAECPKCGGKVVIVRDKTRIKCRGCGADINVEWTKKVELPYR